MWNEGNSEVDQNVLGGQPCTMGHLFSLFVYYLERQVNKESYFYLVPAFVQNLANSELHTGCKTGATLGMGNFVFAEEFKEEAKNTWDYRNFVETIRTKAQILKSFLINYSAHFRPDNDISVLTKKIPSVKENMSFNDYLSKFSEDNLKEIFNDNLIAIEDVFLQYNDVNYQLSPEQEELMTRFNNLILRPCMLAWLAGEYADMVMFRVSSADYGKLSFPDFMNALNDLAYEPASLLEP